MNIEEDNMINIILDGEEKEESLNMLIKLQPSHLYSHMKEKPEDMEILLLAKMLHQGQVDKSGIDYMVHLMHSADIALQLKEQYEVDNNTKIDSSTLVRTLLLHDSLEDEIPAQNARKFNKTVEDLLIEHSVSDKVIESVKDMSRGIEERYSDFIERIREKNNPYSMLGKTSDILSNSHPDRKQKGDIKPSLEKRYNKALRTLGYKGIEQEKPKRKTEHLSLNN
jgi:hypothetical protein